MADRRPVMTAKKSREIERTIYTDWANYHLEKTGIKRVVQDLPKDISDGILLVDIVQFVCGVSVERIHSVPHTTKQKLHNIERCLQVLRQNKVVLNDVSVQGLYRGELKCVLALFFHLSRYKQKEQDFKMTDSSKPGQRRCLRQPAMIGVGRKSRSFNANDRNRVHVDTTPSDNQATSYSVSSKNSVENGGVSAPSRLSAPTASVGVPGWRSKSMSAKHSATTRLLTPKSLGSATLQTFKPESNPTSNRTSVTSQSSDTALTTSLVDKDNKKQTGTLSRLGSPSRLQRPARKPTTSVTNGGTDIKARTNGVGSNSSLTRDKTNKSSLTRPAVRKSIPAVKTVSPTRGAKTPAKNISPPQGSEPPSKGANSKTPRSGTKSTSMISRLKKLGSPTSSNAGTISTKPRTTSASKNVLEPVPSASAVSTSSSSRKRAESCPPTSRLSTVTRPGQLVKPQASTNMGNVCNKGKSPTEKSLKSPSGLKSVKSTLGKAFGGKQGDKKKSPTSPAKTGTLTKTSKKTSGISKSEIHPIIPMVTNANEAVQPIHSHTNGVYVVSDKLANVVCTELPSYAHDVTMTSSSPASDPRCDSTILPERPVEPVSIASPRNTSRAHKTATVAPFLRQSTPVHPNSTIQTPKEGAVTEKAPSSLILRRESPDLKNFDDSSTSAATTPAEAREMAVKGIADLRLNLEETMCSLRNTQLRHRKGDAFQRRISAQLDGEIDENPAQFSGSSSIYRSHHNLLGCRSGARLPLAADSSSPKFHAGETLGHHDEYKFGPGRFSSLQRTRSARYPRTAWREMTTGYASEGSCLTPDTDARKYLSEGVMLSDSGTLPVEGWEKDGSEDGGSVSSGEISDYIGSLSTDENSSTNTSPYHQAKTSQADTNPKHDHNSSKKLANGLSKATMAIDGSTKFSKLNKKRGIGKPPSGSSVVGSRLACNADTPSPTGSPVHQHAFNPAVSRITYSYRSLPRPSKSKMHDEKPSVSSPLASGLHQQSGGNSKSITSTFKRSPSLQKLLNIGKAKQTTATPFAKEESPVILANSHVTSNKESFTTTSSGSRSSSPAKTLLSATSSWDTSAASRREVGQYNSLGRPGKSSRASPSPASYLSLPRRARNLTAATLSSTNSHAAPSSTVMTWSSPKRPNANSAYSISPPTSNPYMSLDLLSTPSLYLDEKDPMNIPDAEDFLKNTDPTALGRGVSDWPLPALHSTTTSSSTNPPSRATSSVASSHKSQSIRGLPDDILSEKDQGKRRPMSSTPSLYSLSEETSAPEKCALQSRLDAKVKKVSQYEESLARESDHMRQLAMTAREKETELHEFKATIETLRNSPSGGLNKKASFGSVSSMSSKVSVSSLGSGEDGLKKRKKHWLRESLKTAFSKRKSRPNINADMDEAESSNNSTVQEEDKDSEVVAQLKEELLKKERKLTDIRLEALTSQHQLHQMQDAMHKMRSEIESLREENERLNRLGLSTIALDVLSRGSDVKHASTYSLADRTENADKSMTVTVEFPPHVINDDTDERSQQECILGECHVARSITWQQLDKKVQQVFQNHCLNVEPSSGLGIRNDAIVSYTVGEATRHVDGEFPDLLPCGYIIGNVDTIIVKLRDGCCKSVDALALELLIDRDTVDKYVRLVLDHGRVMLCGPAGTGKSALANRLAEHVVRMIPKKSGKGSIVKLDLKHRNENEISEYLHQLSDDCSKAESCGREIPVVLVLDNLHRSSRLKEAFLPLLNTAAHSQLPYIIGVAEQNGGSGLELHQEFRWILCSNHAPPVRDYLRRALRRALCSHEITSDETVDDVTANVVNWLPECWDHINRCIETHNSADVTLGPRMFLSCPMDASRSCVWFTDIWNFSIVPYVISAVKQGNKRGKVASHWTDPLVWVKESWPWASPCDLLPIRSEDVASDRLSSAEEATSPPVASQSSSDPLLNMLLKLQEAASTNYESDTSHDDSFERSLDRALGDLS